MWDKIQIDLKSTKMRALAPSVPGGCCCSGQVRAMGLVGRKGKPEGESAVHDEDRGHEEEHVKTHQVVPPDALRGPGAVVVVALDADVAVGAVDRLAGHVESALPAKSTQAVSYMVLPLLGFSSCIKGRAMPGSLRATARQDRVCPMQTILVTMWAHQFWVLWSMQQMMRQLIAAKKMKVTMKQMSMIEMGVQSGPKKRVTYLVLRSTRFLPQERQFYWIGSGWGVVGTNPFSSSSWSTTSCPLSDARGAMDYS